MAAVYKRASAKRDLVGAAVGSGNRHFEGRVDPAPRAKYLASAPLGVAYTEWAHLDDPVIEINLTPNRPDCTGIHGIARDLAAADMGALKDVAIKPVAGVGQARLHRDHGDDKACHHEGHDRQGQPLHPSPHGAFDPTGADPPIDAPPPDAAQAWLRTSSSTASP